MPDFYTADRKYYFVEQGDRNAVVYESRPDGSLVKAVWDRWSYEASLGITTDSPVLPPFIPPPVTPPQSSPPGLVGLTNMIARNINPIGMSYWRNINNHAGKSFLRCFVSRGDQLTLLTVDKVGLSLLEERPLGIHHTGEGCYFSAHQENILYVPMGHGLDKLNVDSGILEPAWISSYNLWQVHSDYNETVHSATLKDSNWQVAGWGVLHNGIEKIYPIKGNPDECQVDKSGEFLVVKEDNYNRVIHIPSGSEMYISNEEGAAGHSDNGFGVILGENDYSPYAGALDLIRLNDGRSRLMYSTGIWNMGYFSFTNASPSPIEQQFGLVTTPSELIKVMLDGSGRGETICSNFTQSQQYEHRPKANLCPLGEYAMWSAFVGGELNAYIARVS